MTTSFSVDFLIGDAPKASQVDLQQVLSSLDSFQKTLQSWPVDQIIDILDEFATNILDRKNDIHNKYPGSGIPFISSWCRKSNLESIVNLSFGSMDKLDNFIPSSFRADRAYKALPKGLVVHWMAGNVPTLGFLSLIQGMLTKNVNLVKVASDSGDFLASVLNLLSEVRKGDPVSGYELAKSVAVVRYDRDRLDLGAEISNKADVRVFWGSDDSVNKLRALPCKLGATDVVFSNKVSMIVIDNDSFMDMDKKAVARRIASDVSIFEQKACASPHTLFVETEDSEELSSFGEELAKAFDSLLKTHPKTVPSQTETSAILNLRAQYDMFHNAWYSDGLEFSILNDDELKLGPAIGNRTLFLRKANNLEKVAELITPNVQTVGILADDKNFDRLTSLFASKGVQRFTGIGNMTNFETPWDGYMIPHHLIRWTSRPQV